MPQIDNNQTQLLKIMIINWRWDRPEKYYHNYTNVLTFSEEKFNDFELFIKKELTQASIKFDPVRDKIEDENAIDRMILPIKVDINENTYSEQVKKLITSLETVLCEKFKREQLEILYLFHKTDSDQKKDKTHKKAIQTFINQRKNRRVEEKFYIFGNGMGSLYDLKKGLLDSSEGEYSIPGDIEYTPYYEKDEQLFEAVKQRNFDYVWTEYWYETTNKLMWMREKVFESLLPNYPQKETEHVRTIVGNFLRNLKKDRKPEAATTAITELSEEYSIYDFTHCDDLKNGKYGFDKTKEFLALLKKYAKGKLKTKQEENDLIKGLNLMVYRIYTLEDEVVAA